MTALNRFGDRVRGFEVIVSCPERKKDIVYGRPTPITGEEALRLMEHFDGKRETLAHTSSEFCAEYLTLEEMRDIFSIEKARVRL